eukprot:scaffold316858_cov21-Prasinocladus_malaysianus.AAC.1
MFPTVRSDSLIVTAPRQRPGAHSFDLTFFMYRLLEMSDDYPVRLRLVEVPDDADFGARWVMDRQCKADAPLPLFHY